MKWTWTAGFGDWGHFGAYLRHQRYPVDSLTLLQSKLAFVHHCLHTLTSLPAHPHLTACTPLTELQSMCIRLQIAIFSYSTHCYHTNIRHHQHGWIRHNQHCRHHKHSHIYTVDLHCHAYIQHHQYCHTATTAFSTCSKSLSEDTQYTEAPFFFVSTRDQFSC